MSVADANWNRFTYMPESQKRAVKALIGGDSMRSKRLLLITLSTLLIILVGGIVFARGTLEESNLEARGFAEDQEQGIPVIVATKTHYREGELEEPLECIRFATTSLPGSPEVEALNLFSYLLNNASDGEIFVQVIHSAKVSPMDLVLKVLDHEIDMIVAGDISSIANLLFEPQLSVFSSAFLFRDNKHLSSFARSPFASGIFDGMAQRTNIRILDAWYAGTHHLFVNGSLESVRCPEDLSGIVVYSTCENARADICKVLGAREMTLDGQSVYQTMSSNQLCGIEATIPCVASQACAEAVRSVIMTGHYIETVTPIIAEELWQALSIDQQFLIVDSLKAAGLYIEQAVKKLEEQAIGKLIMTSGAQVIVPEKQTFFESALAYYSGPRFAHIIGEDLFRHVQSY